jgi:hypothetical protein
LEASSIKTTTPKTQRSTLAKRIAALADSGQTHNAALLASYGKELSWSETLVRNYYLSREEVEAAMKECKKLDSVARLPFDDTLKKANERFAEAYKIYKKHDEILTLSFLVAVRSHDRDAIIRLADAVMFFKNKQEAMSKDADPEGAKLLYLKMALQDSESGKSWTLREIAGVIGHTPTNSDLADGFSGLRRKCRRLGVPFCESRPRKKK